MDIIPGNEVFQPDKRNTKKTLLPTDSICIDCGIIFNSVYEDRCVICDKPGAKEIGAKEIDRDEYECEHKEFISGRESVDLRILLDYHIEDLRALCEIHGCSGGSRSKMTISILKKLYPALDERINDNLIRKMIKRNHKRFRFWRDIEDAIVRAKKSGKIRLVDVDECIITDITAFGKKQ